MALEVSNTLEIPEREKIVLELALYEKENRRLQRQTRSSKSALAPFKRRVKANEDLKSERDQQQKESMNFRNDLYVEHAKSADLENPLISIELEDDVCKACRRRPIGSVTNVSILMVSAQAQL